MLYEVVSTVCLCHMHSSPPCCVDGSWVSSGLLYSGSLYNANPLLVAKQQHPDPYLNMAIKQCVHAVSTGDMTPFSHSLSEVIYNNAVRSFTSSAQVALVSGAMPECSPVPLAPPCPSLWCLTLQQSPP